MEIDLHVLFEKERNGALKLINTGGNLIKYLCGRSSLCPLLSKNKDIKYIQKLGEGVQGVVYEIDFPNKGPKQYVVKKSKEHKYHKCSQIKSYKRFDGEGVTKVSPRSIICDQEYSEYALALLLGDIASRGVCINFVDVFAFATCNNKNENTIYNYTFMEKAHSTLRKKVGCIFGSTDKKTKLTNFLLIQILFAIATYQKEYEIVHGDLHADNIFLFYDYNMQWKSQKITNFDYFEYKIGKTSIYLPAIPIIVKIGDLGYGVKYKKNMIGNSYVLEKGYDQGKGEGPILPNFFTKAYDLMYVLDEFREKNPSNEFIKSMVAYVAGLKSDCKDSELDKKFDTLVNPRNRRPKIKEISKLTHVTPEAILTNHSIMGKYLKKPKGNIINIGEI